MIILHSKILFQRPRKRKLVRILSGVTAFLFSTTDIHQDKSYIKWSHWLPHYEFSRSTASKWKKRSLNALENFKIIILVIDDFLINLHHGGNKKSKNVSANIQKLQQYGCRQCFIKGNNNRDPLSCSGSRVITSGSVTVL